MKPIDDKWIADLKTVALEKAEALKRVADADRRIAALVDQVVGAAANGSQQTISQSEPAATGGNGSESNTSEQILALLRSEPTKKWRYQEIADRLPGPKMATIRSLLYRMEKTSPPKVVKSGRGKFKAALNPEQAK